MGAERGVIGKEAGERVEMKGTEEKRTVKNRETVEIKMSEGGRKERELKGEENGRKK